MIDYQAIKNPTLNDDIPLVDPWTTEEFEKEISSALISLYESRVTGQKHNHPQMRLSEQDLVKARKLGVFIGDPNRLLVLDSYDEMYELPKLACTTMSWVGKHEESSTNLEGYQCNIMAEQVLTLPKSYKRLGGGKLFKLCLMVATEKGGVNGRVSYVSVDKSGEIHNTDLTYNNTSRTEVHKRALFEEKRAASIVLNSWADKVNTWSIVAQESDAKCEVGVEVEQIKSLLYARTLPLTVTGRKRPILHLVASHRRRMKEGIDIDISQYLRGIEKVEIGGTIFTVKPAEILKLKK